MQGNARAYSNRAELLASVIGFLGQKETRSLKCWETCTRRNTKGGLLPLYRNHIVASLFNAFKEGLQEGTSRMVSR